MSRGRRGGGWKWLGGWLFETPALDRILSRTPARDVKKFGDSKMLFSKEPSCQ